MSGSDNVKSTFIGNAQADTLGVKHLTVGSRGTVNGAWITYVPVVRGTFWDPVFGGTVTATAKYRVVGSTMDLEMLINSTVAASAGSGTYRFPLPPGFVCKDLNPSPCGVGHLRANTFNAPAYVIPDGTNLAFLLLRFNITEASALGGDAPVSSTDYDSNSTNGVTYRFRATFEIAGV